MTVIRCDMGKTSSGECGYPAPFDAPCRLYQARELSDVAGLTQFGVGVETLLPGGMSSQRHWHEEEDEFLYMLTGEAILIEDDGEHTLRPGDAVGWKAGEPNAHHIVNRSDQPASYIIMGTRAQTERVHYPDIDLSYTRDEAGRRFTHKNGTPYPAKGDKS